MTDSMRDRIDGVVDKGTGQGKEAIGNLTDQADVKREGQVDQAKGEGEGVVADLKDKASDLLKKVTGDK